MMSNTAKHAGLLIPLDMFRISQLAALFGEQLVGKARNILDAKLVLTRHPEAPILLVTIEGTVVGNDPPAFWRENADLAAFASRAFPRQVILYYVDATSPATRREGFVVAQQGQVVAADDATASRMPPGSTDADWPVSRLCQQLRIPVSDLAEGFPGGPSVDASLVKPHVDDQALLMKLLGRDEGGNGEAAAPAPARQNAASSPRSGRPPATGPAAAPADAKPSAADDAKRRAKQIAEQDAEQERRAAELSSRLPLSRDEVGVVVAPKALLSEPDLLRPYIQPKIDGDLPRGVPREMTEHLQGKRLDLAVPVEFLSEVFLENTPLTKPRLRERADVRTIGGHQLMVIEVLGPRLGYGTLVSSGTAHVFVSRKPDLPLPAELILKLLGAGS